MRAVIKRADGGISIIVPASGYDIATLVREHLKESAIFTTDGDGITVRTDTEELVAICNEDGTDPDNGAVIIPASRTYRDCWHKSGDGCAVDMVEARKARTDELRVVRAEKWPDIDARRNRAAEDGDDAAMAQVKIDAKKLRDMPVDVQSELNAITDPEALKARIPVSLK
jgi:hypothetical protein